MKYLMCLLLVMALPAFAAQEYVERSMVVTGTITVNPDGSVQGYTLHDPDKLPPGVVQVVKKTVPGWEFRSVLADGTAVTAKAGMSLRIVADMIDATHAAIRVAGAEFGCGAWQVRKLSPDACPVGATVTYAHRTPPTYPFQALNARASGDVYLVLEIGRDGSVTRAAVRRVNLRSLQNLTETNLKHYRRVLAKASLAAARRWRFSVPNESPNAAKDYWIVQVPIRYWLGRSGATHVHYGQWNAYAPGPVQDIPWAENDGAANGSADAIAGGGPFVRDARFVLKTPLAGGPGQS